MGRPSAPAPVKVIVGLLAASPALLEEATAALTEEVAPIELRSDARRWAESGYYAGEMGEEIWRQFVALAGLARAADLAALKWRTNVLEARWAGAGRRRVNLDPGYMDLQKLVLASTKDAAHRVYLGRGIYAEATLRFTRDGWAPWPYTYADYAAADARAFFTRVRARYRAERRAARPGRGPRGRPDGPGRLRSRG